MPITDDINLRSNRECAVSPRKSHASIDQVCGELRLHPAVYGRINGDPWVSQCEAEQRLNHLRPLVLRLLHRCASKGFAPDQCSGATAGAHSSSTAPPQCRHRVRRCQTGTLSHAVGGVTTCFPIQSGAWQWGLLRFLTPRRCLFACFMVSLRGFGTHHVKPQRRCKNSHGVGYWVRSRPAQRRAGLLWDTMPPRRGGSSASSGSRATAGTL